MDVAEHLRDRGYRSTPQRELVWDVLRRARGHLTVEEIHAEVIRAAPDFNLASVYRILTLLAELGLVKEVHLVGDRGHWELAHPDDAFHLVCESCGGVDHHTGTLVEQIRAHLDDAHGFESHRVDLVVHGRCDGCRGAVDDR